MKVPTRLPPLLRWMSVPVILMGLPWAWPDVAPSPITLTVQAGISATNVVLVRRTLAAFDGIIASEMDTRIDHPVRLFLCKGTNGYREVLEREFRTKPEQAARSARLTGGMSKNTSNGGLIAIRFDGDAVAMGKGTQTMAHELFHQVQGQLAKKGRGKAAYYLSEGTADYVAAYVASRLGMQSLDRWKLERVNRIRRASQTASPEEIVHTDLDRWTTLLDNGLHPYEMADLMVFDIMKKAGDPGLRAIAHYWRNLGMGSNEAGAFRAAFGFDSAAFLSSFTTTLGQVKDEPVGIQVLPWKGASPPGFADFSTEVRDVLSMLSEDWGWDLTQGRRFIVAGDGASTVDARIVDLGQNLSVAEQKTAANTRWMWAGNTAVFRLDEKYTVAARQRDVVAVTCGMLFSEAASRSSLDQVAWLHAGMVEMACAQFLNRTGVLDWDVSAGDWEKNYLKKAGRFGLPDLRTSARFQSNTLQHGSKAVTGISALAVSRLENDHGIEPFKAWAHGLGTRRDVATFFKETFGEGLLEFEKRMTEEIKDP